MPDVWPNTSICRAGGEIVEVFKQSGRAADTYTTDCIPDTWCENGERKMTNSGHEEATTAPHVSEEPQKNTRGKIARFFHDMLTQLQENISEKFYAPHTTAPTSHTPSPAPPASEHDASVEALLDTHNTIEREVVDLLKYHGTLGRQVKQLCGLSPEEQQSIISRMLQTLKNMEKSLTTVQDANNDSQPVLQEKRLLLDTRSRSVSEAQEEEALRLNTIQELRQSNGQLSRDNLHKEKAIERLQQQCNTLSQQYDALVGESHQTIPNRFSRAAETAQEHQSRDVPSNACAARMCQRRKSRHG